MTRPRTIALALTLIAFPATGTLTAQEWDLLGTRRVSFSAESDVIEVSRRDGRFNAIRLEVDNASLELFNIRIVFANGESFAPETRISFREGEKSRVIDLPGEARSIDRIVFRYRSGARRGNSVVRVFGRRGGADVSAARGDWERIGSQQVGSRADFDKIELNGNIRFRSIRLEVNNADIELFNVRVNFSNGEHFSPDTRLIFREGSRSRVIDLPGAARAIESIGFGYRTAEGDNRKATVVVYGRR